MEIEITFLGTGSAYPSPTRGASCIALRHEAGLWLVDCGEGTQVQLMKSTLRPGKINKIFITHLHGDHMFGLPGLMCTISQNSSHSEPVEGYGPRGLRRFLRVSLELSRSLLGFQYTVHELATIPEQLPLEWQNWKVDHSSSDELFHPNEILGRLITADDNQIWHLFSDDHFTVKALWLRHKIPSFGYCIEEKPSLGKLDAAALKARGLPPGPLYQRLKMGEAVTLQDGTVVLPAEVMGPPRPGRKVLLMGDSCDSDQLLKLGHNADVLVHEATMENAATEAAIEYGHSTPAMVTRLARQLSVKQLILTHLSQRFKPASMPLKMGEDSAQKIQDQAEADMGGDKVICAEDFMTYTVPPRSAS